MVSPVAVQHEARTAPGRNPRRRARKDVEETGSLRLQPLRKRHKSTANSVPSVSTQSALVNGHEPTEDVEKSRNVEIPLREREVQQKEQVKVSDYGLDIFSQNEHYSIGQLPGFPKELRANGEDFRGSFLPSASLVCAITRKSAYIWDYTSRSNSPPTYSLKLPFTSRPDEPVPLGAIVKPSLHGDTGLVVIGPRSGKVKYWENIDNVDALSLFENRRDGSEGSLGLYSGEVAVDLQDAQHAGFVVTTSSGRVAQLLLRDPQSRPSINVQYFRTPRRNTSGGLLGGIMNVFGTGGLMKDIAAVRVCPSHVRGPTDMILASEHSIFQHWKVSWADAPSLQFETQATEPIDQAVRARFEQRLPGPIHYSRLIDVTFMPSPKEPDSHFMQNQSGQVSMIGLLMITGSSYKSYAICAISLDADGKLELGRSTLLDSYMEPLSTASLWRPRLCVASALTAIVFFEKAIVPVSIADIQKEDDGGSTSSVFQDAIYLKDDSNIHLAGMTPEPFDSKLNRPSGTFLIPGTGALRVVIEDSKTPERAISPNKLSVKSKIEQVILYSNKQSNPFNLSRRPDVSVSLKEIEEVAIEISTSVLTTEYLCLANYAAATDLNLQRRAQALEALARHLKDNYRGLSRVTKWRLLWDAEKMATAQEVWRQYNVQVAGAKRATHRKFLLPELVELMSPELKSMRGSHFSTIDQLREFFLADVVRLQYLLTWTYNAIYDLAQDEQVRESENLMELILDATDIVCLGLETAFKFRTENLSLYDLEDEDLSDGILRAGYEGLPEFWTSTYQGASKIRELTVNAQNALLQEFEDCRNEERLPSKVVQSITTKNPRLIYAWSRVFEERCRWFAASSDLNTHKDDGDFRTKCENTRSGLLMKLSQLDQTFPGMEIAEKVRDMVALTKLVRDESEDLVLIAKELDIPEPNETVKLERERLKKLSETKEAIEDLEKRIAQYCNIYGYTFTNPYYGAIVNKHAYGTLLDQSVQYRREVTHYLRAEPNRRPLAWLNETLSEHDYAVAGQALIDHATSSEAKAWNRSIELGFAKLVLLAADEGHDFSQDVQTSLWSTNAARYAHTSTLLHVQTRVWEHIRDLTYAALDHESMVQLLMESLGRKLKVTSRSSLYSLLERDFEALVNDNALGAESLIDVLTLIDRRVVDHNEGDISGQEFFLGLLALKNDESVSKERKDMLGKMIWRRAMLADDPPNDWKSVNEALTQNRLSDKDVQSLLRDTTVYKTFVEGYKFTLLNSAEQVDDDAGGGALLSFLEDMATPDPHECVSAGTRAQDWIVRFGEERYDLAEPIAAEVSEERDLLIAMIEEQQLVKWWEACREVALADVTR